MNICRMFPFSRINFLLTDQVGKFNQARYSAGVIVGPRPIYVCIIMSSDNNALAGFIPEKSDNILIFFPPNCEFLYGCIGTGLFKMGEYIFSTSIKIFRIFITPREIIIMIGRLFEHM